MSKQVSRRRFLQGLGLAAAGAAAAACQPKTVIVEKPVEVTKIVKETVMVEGKEVEVTKIVKETVMVEKEKIVEKEVEVTRMVTAGELSGELIFWGHDDHPHDLAATGFVDKYPNVEWISPHPADWGTKFTAALAAGEGCPDLYWAEATRKKTTITP
jgi:hypothetical protein